MRISGDVVIPCLSHSNSTQQQLQSLHSDNVVYVELFCNLESPTESVCNSHRPSDTVPATACSVPVRSAGQQQWKQCEWTRDWPGCALNMRSIRDSCQPSGTLGGNQRLNGFRSPSVGKSCRTMRISLTSVSAAWLMCHAGYLFGPVSALSVPFWHIVIKRD